MGPGGEEEQPRASWGKQLRKDVERTSRFLPREEDWVLRRADPARA